MEKLAIQDLDPPKRSQDFDLDRGKIPPYLREFCLKIYFANNYEHL